MTPHAPNDLVSVSSLSGSGLTKVLRSDLVVFMWSCGAPHRSTGFVLLTGDSRSFSPVPTFSLRYLCFKTPHRKLHLRPSHLTLSPLRSGFCRSCVCGIPPSSRILSPPQSSTTVFLRRVASFVSLHWDSGEICWATAVYSDEYLFPPHDTPFFSSSLSNSGVPPVFILPPLKQEVGVNSSDLVVNPTSWAWPNTVSVLRLAGLVLKCLRWWVWPIIILEKANLFNSLTKPSLLELVVQLLLADWVCVNSSKISDGFIGVFTMRSLSYLSFMKKFSVDSPWLPPVTSSSSIEESFLQLCLLSMKGDGFSDLPSISFSLLTSLLSCVAVCTGPEDAIEITLIIFVGEGWTSTSYYLTNFQLSDSVVKAYVTHSSSDSNSLSTSQEEDLSFLCLSTIVVYVFFKRGCNIPSSHVSKQS